MSTRCISLAVGSLLIGLAVGSACSQRAKMTVPTMTVPATTMPTTTKHEFHEVSEVAALPADFPAKEIPTPPLRLVYTSGESGGLLLRYVSTDAKTDALAYRKVLVAAGYSVTGDGLDLEGPTLAFTVVARNATHHLDINRMLATSGSQYLDVIVDKP